MLGSCHKRSRKTAGVQPWAENPDPLQRLENEVPLLPLLSGSGWYIADAAPLACSAASSDSIMKVAPPSREPTARL